MPRKKVYLIRHAKSSWKDASLDDFDRPLNKRGKKDAPFMAEVLREHNIIPDIIISSPALRAKTTAQTIAEGIGYKNILFLDDIYEATPETLQKILMKLDDSYKVVFLVGHNPSLKELAEKFVGLDENIPTCGIVAIEFACKKWSDINPENAKLVMFDYPKRYEEE